MSASKQVIEFPTSRDYWDSKVIIAMKGLPITGKSEIGGLLGQWARCQVLYIDEFLDTLSLERGDTTGEEAQRLYHLALEALYRAALRHMRFSDRGVVIKSRLCSAFELDLLIRLANESSIYSPRYNIVIIIECEMKNEYRRHTRLEYFVRRVQATYPIRSWKDDDECLDSQAWDHHLLSSLNHNNKGHFARLVVDPFDDLYFSTDASLDNLTPDFLDTIKYLLIRRSYFSYRGEYYKAVKYDELRRDLFEKELRSWRVRSKYVCTSTTTMAASCVFKFREALPAGGDECCCGACGQRVVSGEAAYSCHFCILTLHKSCAHEKLDFSFLNPKMLYSVYYFGYNFMCSERHDEKIACKSCREGGKNFSKECESCVFEAHLKSGWLPTIINHDSHPLHLLSMQFEPQYKSTKTCKACGNASDFERYVCHICKYFYHLECVFLPREVKHEHGGYEHVMKLKYTHDGMDQEDDHWCNVCYEDMDPQTWFYACQDCPYYVTHAHPNCVGEERMNESISNGNLPIQQIRDKLKVDETS